VTGLPDGLERLWTPHRMAYVTGGDKPTSNLDTPSGCPFCLAPTRPTDEGLVVARGRTVFAVLNLYPYNPGHLMVCPYRHVPDYTELDEAETVELAQFTQTAISVIRTVSGAHGFNVGMNLGHVAGAGIAGHLHQHVVPRWGGDTNFMPVISRTKTMPQLLADTRRLLAAQWKSRGGPAPAGLAPAASAPSASAPSGAAPQGAAPSGAAPGGAAASGAAPGGAAPSASAPQGAAAAGAAKKTAKKAAGKPAKKAPKRAPRSAGP
jgi:ATP adenylyltransferase